MNPCSVGVLHYVVRHRLFGVDQIVRTLISLLSSKIAMECKMNYHTTMQVVALSREACTYIYCGTGLHIMNWREATIHCVPTPQDTD